MTESIPEDDEAKLVKNRFNSRQKNMKLINQIETDQAPYFGLNAKHHQHEDPYGGAASARKSIMKEESENNFKIAKQLSYDLSSEFKGYTPRQEGFVEECRIGDVDLIEFREHMQEEEEEKEASEVKNAPVTCDEQSSDSSCTS